MSSPQQQIVIDVIPLRDPDHIDGAGPASSEARVAEINKRVDDFVKKWSPTHVVLGPNYLTSPVDGLVLEMRAVTKDMLNAQAKAQGEAQAVAEHAGASIHGEAQAIAQRAGASIFGEAQAIVQYAGSKHLAALQGGVQTASGLPGPRPFGR